MKIMLHTYKDRQEVEVEIEKIHYISPGLNECTIHFLDDSVSIRVHEDIDKIGKIIKQAKGGTIK